MRLGSLAPLAVLMVASGVAASGGCAHSPRTVWTPGDRMLCAGRVCYRVGPLGTGWQMVHEEGAEIGFYNRRIAGIIQGNATCRDDAETAPLASLTDHLLIGYTERHPTRTETVAVDGREALHSIVKAKLDGVPLILDLYVLKRNGCIFDLSYVAPPDTYEDGGGDFGEFVAGFADARKAL